MRSIRPSTTFFPAMLGALSLSWAGAAEAAMPEPARSLEDALRQTAAVIEGNVVSVRYAYDEADGPRTVATLEGIVVRLGDLGRDVPSSLELRSFGGFLPDGREVIATHVPRIASGQRVFLFLRNTEWTLSPVTSDLALRLVTLGSARALVDPYGRLVMGFSERGVRAGLSFFAEPMGGLEPSRPERIAASITERDVDAALDADELTEALFAFARATNVWPSGAFSPRPRSPFASWRRVPTPPPAVSATNDSPETALTSDAAMLACFGPPSSLASNDADPGELEMCLAEGGAP